MLSSPSEIIKKTIRIIKMLIIHNCIYFKHLIVSETHKALCVSDSIGYILYLVLSLEWSYGSASRSRIHLRRSAPALFWNLVVTDWLLLKVPCQCWKVKYIINKTFTNVYMHEPIYFSMNLKLLNTQIV